jgi:hypothetical protein
MKVLRKYIRKEIQSLHEQKSYPVPVELLDVMNNILQMRPLKRYVNNIKAINSIPPSYRIFLHNAQSFDIIYAGNQENNFRVKINGKEYDLLSREEKSLALGALSNLLTADLPPNFGKQDNDEPADGGDFGGTTGGGTTTSPAGTADDTAMEPDEDEPEETEPEPDMI